MEPKISKGELAAAVASRTGMSNAAAAGAVDAVLDLIADAIGKGQEVRVLGFGNFTVSKRRTTADRNSSVSPRPSAPRRFRPARPLKGRRMGIAEAGDIDPDAVAKRFGVATTELAEMAGLSRGAFDRGARSADPAARVRLRELVTIVERVLNWAGGEHQAIAWYRAQSIPALGDRTAESLVKSGQARAVYDYLDRIALGSYA